MTKLVTDAGEVCGFRQHGLCTSAIEDVEPSYASIGQDLSHRVEPGVYTGSCE